MVRLFARSPKLALGIAQLGGGALAAAEKDFRAGDDNSAIERFGRGVLGNSRFDALSDERHQQVWDNRGTDRAQALYKGFPNLIEADVGKITTPALLLAGDESPAVFRYLNDDLSARITGSRNEIIGGASHVIHEDAPSAFNKAVLSFLAEVG